jgi:hypothetical protein
MIVRHPLSIFMVWSDPDFRAGAEIKHPGDRCHNLRAAAEMVEKRQYVLTRVAAIVTIQAFPGM